MNAANANFVVKNLEEPFTNSYNDWLKFTYLIFLIKLKFSNLLNIKTIVQRPFSAVCSYDENVEHCQSAIS